MDHMTVPPIRRILVEEAPTIARAPAPANGTAQAAPAAGPARVRRPRAAAEVVERMRCESLSLSYGTKMAVRDVSLTVRRGEVLALIGASGSGKTTLLRSLNRLTELTPGAGRRGRITLDGEDIDRIDVTALRRRVSMVFQQPNPFPMSLFDNVAFALREQGARRPSREDLRPQVVDALTRAGLYDEVSSNLAHPALALSGGQQQRLCIARALAAGPEVLLLDEPCSALDPISTATIEKLIMTLREEVAIVIVTHNLQQARRVADQVAFMHLGDLVEAGLADEVFTQPRERRTREYVAGAFG